RACDAGLAAPRDRARARAALLPASRPRRAGGGDALSQARLPVGAGRADSRTAAPRARRGGDRPGAPGERSIVARVDRRGLFEAKPRAGVLKTSVRHKDRPPAALG